MVSWTLALYFIVSYSYRLFGSLPSGAFRWPITSIITLTFNLNNLIEVLLPRVFIVSHPVNILVGGNQRGENPRLSAECWPTLLA